MIPDTRSEHGNAEAGSASETIRRLRGDYARGWLVARNPDRALNHLPLLREYLEIASRLGLFPTIPGIPLSAPESPAAASWGNWEKNAPVLEEHLRGAVSTRELLRRLAPGREEETRRSLRSLYPLAHMEFHPTDLCNLDCQGCTYTRIREDEPEKDIPAVFPFPRLDVLRKLNPAAIVVVGGGEPTLYRDSQHRFNQLIQQIHRLLPTTRLALITNGVFFPPGQWYHCLDWARISIDAAEASTYRAFRGRDMFQEVCRNLLNYLQTPIPYTGVGFLYSTANIHEYAGFIRFFHSLVNANLPESLDKFNIQFRPLRQDPRQQGLAFPESVSPEQIKAVVRELAVLAAESREMEEFIKNRTNATTVEQGNAHQPLSFSACFYSLIFNILRADGRLFPCFVNVDEPGFCLGNILHDSPETIVLNRLIVAGRPRAICRPEACRQCHLNHCLEQGLKKTRRALVSPEISCNPFF